MFMRASGIVAWVLLLFSVVLGLLRSGHSARPQKSYEPSTRSARRRTGGMTRWRPFLVHPYAVAELHDYTALLGLLAALVHPALLLLDAFMPFTVRQLLVPGAAPYRPLPVALGTVALYVWVVVYLTSLARRHLSQPLWHGLHLLAYPLFLLATIHGITSGTDSGATWLQALYAVGFLSTAILTVRRLRSLKRARASVKERPVPV